MHSTDSRPRTAPGDEVFCEALPSKSTSTPLIVSKRKPRVLLFDWRAVILINDCARLLLAMMVVRKVTDMSREHSHPLLRIWRSARDGKHICHIARQCRQQLVQYLGFEDWYHLIYHIWNIKQIYPVVPPQNRSDEKQLQNEATCVLQLYASIVHPFPQLCPSPRR